MSMNLQLKQANAGDLSRYLRDGVDEDDFDFGAGMDFGAGLDFRAVEHWPEEREKAVPNDPMAARIAMAREHLARLDAPRGSPATPGPAKTERTPQLDLHKSWHMLHYLFTGTAWEGETPAATLLLGGQEVGEGMGYGPARVLSATDTAKFAGFLGGIDLEQLIGRLDVAAMRKLEIYCAPDDDDDMELNEDLGVFFPQLQAFVADAAQKGNGLLIWMA